MKLNKNSGAVLAAAAFTMALSGASFTASTASADEANVQCFGVNSCKGTADCKTASNECKGMNSCKGQGFLSMTKSMCDEKGGTVEN